MPMSNEDIVARYWDEFWSKGDLSVADEIFTEDVRDRDPASPWVKPGREGMKELCQAYRAVFPDLVFTQEKTLSCGNTVVSYWKATGTHQGEVFGVAPTGRTIEVVGISILPIENGRITEQIIVWDAMGLMQQIGGLQIG